MVEPRQRLTSEQLKTLQDGLDRLQGEYDKETRVGALCEGLQAALEDLRELRMHEGQKAKDSL